jgi:hypothetical protein
MKSFLAVAACAASLVAAPAFAADSFAIFGQQTGVDTVTFANNSDGTGTLSSDGSALFDFKFISPFLSFLDPDLTSYQDAFFSLDATAVGPAAISGGVVEQSISNGVITFTRATPLEGKTNLLTIAFTDAFLWGPQGAFGLNLIGSAATGTVTFTSDFVDFSSATERDFNFSIQGMTTPVGLGAGGVLNSFTADANGIASANAAGAIPEPGTWALMILGFGGMGAMLRTRKRMLAFA